MKKIPLILAALTLSLCVMAQEKTKQNEVGLVFNNLNNFGLTFKTGTSESLWRLRTLFIKGSNDDRNYPAIEDKENTFGFGLSLGKEFRKKIDNNFEIRYGADLSFSYYFDKMIDDGKVNDDLDLSNKMYSYSPGVNLVLGVNYVINNKLIIGAELLPHITYNYTTNTQILYNAESKTKNTNITYGFSNNSAMLTLAYRF